MAGGRWMALMDKSGPEYARLQEMGLLAGADRKIRTYAVGREVQRAKIDKATPPEWSRKLGRGCSGWMARTDETGGYVIPQVTTAARTR